MASATGIPETGTNHAHGEHEPLLGRPGDAVQKEGRPLYENLFLGTGIVAQTGIWVLTAVIWSGVFSHPLILFSAHPLLNSAGILLLIQAALTLQPTHTAEQKRYGTYVHAILNPLGVLALLAGLIVIEYNKISHGGTHFVSPHAILGLVTYILIGLQAVVGLTQFFAPELYGGVDNAKTIYKYHRAGGYVTYLLAGATVAAATWTDYNEGVLKIQHWAVIATVVITAAGVGARVKKEKLGF